MIRRKEVRGGRRINPMMNTYRSHSVRETEEIAEQFAKTLHPGDVVAYTGDLGAGKTAFTRGMARGLGIADEVASPTFALVHEYRGTVILYHFDMYRITDFDDLYSTGFFDYLDDPNAILAIEWSENIDGVLPPGTITVAFTVLGEEEREIKISREE